MYGLCGYMDGVVVLVVCSVGCVGGMGTRVHISGWCGCMCSECRLMICVYGYCG